MNKASFIKKFKNERDVVCRYSLKFKYKNS